MRLRMWLKSILIGVSIVSNAILLPGKPADCEHIYLDFICKKFMFAFRVREVKKLDNQERKELVKKIRGEINSFKEWFVAFEKVYNPQSIEKIQKSLSSSLKSLEKAIAQEPQYHEEQVGSASAHRPWLCRSLSSLPRILCS